VEAFRAVVAHVERNQERRRWSLNFEIKCEADVRFGGGMRCDRRSEQQRKPCRLAGAVSVHRKVRLLARFSTARAACGAELCHDQAKNMKLQRASAGASARDHLRR